MPLRKIARIVVGSRYQVVPWLLVSTYTHVVSFAEMHVELANLERLHIVSVSGEEGHVVTCQLHHEVFSVGT